MTIKTANFEVSVKTKQLSLVTIFSITLFFSAGLIFWLEPLVAKMLLPYLGGAPAVWNVCVLFFQISLLAGYFYAYLSSTKLSINKQACLHIILLAISLFFLPISLKHIALINDHHPIGGLLLVLFTSIGFPFFVLAGTGPMLQRWFSFTLHPSAKDPYFLYCASNTGSLIALISYPFILEPTLNLITQSELWLIFYIIQIGLLILCSITVSYISYNKALYHKYSVRAKLEQNTEKWSNKATYQQRFSWLCYAFIPSSLLLGVTTYITNDVASIPLLWVMPLALYLLSFIITFAHKPLISKKVALTGQFCCLFPFLFVMAFPNQIHYIALVYFIHLATFFFTALVCNSELIKRRPVVNDLTEFYLWLALGGVLGALFNTLVAPVVFTHILEYPLMIACACLIRPAFGKIKHPKFSWNDITLPVLVALVVYVLGLLIKYQTTQYNSGFIMLSFTLLAILVFSFPDKPLRFGLGIGALLISSILFLHPLNENTIYSGRNFFGTLRVLQLNNNAIHLLIQGQTIQGAQFYGDAPQTQSEFNPVTSHFSLCGPNTQQQVLGLDTISRLYNKNAITYYVPLQEIISDMAETTPNLKVAIAGLGTGTAACFARPRDEFDFFEINPLAVKIASNTHFFTYLSNCPPHEIVIGDARLALQKVPNHYYDIIVLDAFNSDAIPMHLLTREALTTYLTKLKPDGLLVFNITNKNLDLRYSLSALADNLRLVARVSTDKQNLVSDYKLSSTWVVMARNTSDLGDLAFNPEWQPMPPDDDSSVWTDNYSNILAALK